MVFTSDTGEMALRGRIGGFAKAARHSREELTRAARDGFLARFEREVDPDGILAEQERKRRAVAARNAHMARLALKSAIVRRQQVADSKKKATAPTVAQEVRDVAARSPY